MGKQIAWFGLGLAAVLALSCGPTDSAPAGGGSGGSVSGTGGRGAVGTGGGAAVGTGGVAPAGSGGAPLVVGSGGAPSSASGGSDAIGTGGQATGGSDSTGGAAGGGEAGRGQGRSGGSGVAGRSGGPDGGAPDAGSGTGGNTGAGGGAPGQPVKTAGCGSTTAPKSGTYNISVDGLSRSYILKLPDNYDANKPYRLLLLFHPLGGTAADVAMNWHNLPALANNSMIFVAPDGISKGWADAGTTATQPGRDMQFTKTLVNDLSGKLCVDKTRIFAEGFSFGAAMSYAVACAMGDVVRGVVVIAGAKLSGCVQHTKPVAYLMIHGTSDSTLRYPGAGLPLLNDFAKVNGCTPQPIPDPRNSQFACVDYTGCMPGYPARGCLWPGGHTWKAPGTWLPEQAWKFISQF